MRGMRIKIASGLAMTAAVVLTVAGVAIATKPVKGAVYKGEATATRKYYGHTFGGPVSFKVSANGKRVKKLNVPIPVYCQYGGVNPPKPGSARVTGHGTFKAKLKYYTVDHQYEGTVTVNGKFQTGGKESGALRSHWAKNFRNCDTTWTYSTTD